MQSVILDPELIRKYDYSGPRYTSYPTVLSFRDSYREADLQQTLRCRASTALSLYVHLPFCYQLCYFCACNKVVTRHQQRADDYLAILEKEIAYRAAQLVGHTITQLHWGGGTPTFLSKQQISHLMERLRTSFHFAESVACSIEIDPRHIALDLLVHLQQEGFNRISIGIQDFDKNVQRLINREQDEAFISAFVCRAHELGFKSINFDLIYGLPQQDCYTFTQTIMKVIALAPTRLSLFNYAHLPHRFPAQRKMKSIDLPSANEKLAILQQAIHLLTENRYQLIGMDHFALPEDELSWAQKNGQLHRNFQGYSVGGGGDLLGVGVSAISKIGNSYVQNQRSLSDYVTQVNQQGHAVWRGITMTRDDCIRYAVIQALMCYARLEYAALEELYSIVFKDYFRKDLQRLHPLAADGLVDLNPQGIEVTPRGRLLIRHICLCFDFYNLQLPQKNYSRLI